MPGYKGHLIGGLAVYAIVYQTTTNPAVNSALQKIFHFNPFHYSGNGDMRLYAIAMSFACCLLGSLFPDVDTKSVGQKLFYYIMAGIITFTVIKKQWGLLSALSLISLFPLLVNHRGIIHTIWFVTLAPLVVPLIVSHNHPALALLCWQAYVYFVTGALSHLILDKVF